MNNFEDRYVMLFIEVRREIESVEREGFLQQV